MSLISIETNNENQLTVEEYIHYVKIKDRIQQILDNENLMDVLQKEEKSINGLSIDLIIRYSIDKKKH